MSENVIPALPGWTAINYTGEPGAPGFRSVRHPVIGWVVEEGCIPVPLLDHGRSADGVERPDGTFVDYHGRTVYPSFAAFKLDREGVAA